MTPLPNDPRTNTDATLARMRIGTRRRPDVVLEIPEFHMDDDGTPVIDEETGMQGMTLHEFRVRGFLSIPEQRQVLQSYQRVADVSTRRGNDAARSMEMIDATNEGFNIILSFIHERYPWVTFDLIQNLDHDEVMAALNLIATGRNDQTVEQNVANALTDGAPTMEQMMAADPEQARRMLDEIEKAREEGADDGPLASTTRSTTGS
jgi:hypothetical protein